MIHRHPRSGNVWALPGRAWLPVAIAILFSTSVSSPAFANSSQPLPRVSGGFQEGTGAEHHSAHDVNQGRSLGGDLRIDGAPRGYQPGQTYPITLTISHPGQSRWGFEISARQSDSGAQAGTWTPVDRMAQIKTESGIQCGVNTAEGTHRGEKDGPIEYRLKWTAPDKRAGLVIFNATGTASDGSDSPYGDYIYTAGAFSRPTSGPQEPEAVEVEAVPAKASTREQETSRVANLPSPVDLQRGSFEVMIQHRFLDAADAGAGEAFGIDSGANINLGVNYALTDRLSAGVSRTRFDKIIELAGTYEIRTTKDSKWKLALRGGVEGKDNFQQHYSTFVQLAGSFDNRILRLNAVPMVMFNSRPDDQLEFNRARMINPDSNHTLSLGLGADVALNRRYSLMMEYVPRLAGYGGLGERRDQLATGLSIRTWGHVFTVLVATSRDFNPSKYGVNSEYRSLALGFNLYRRIR